MSIYTTNTKEGIKVIPGELRQAKWADIDLDAGEWRYTVPKTKTDHIVPLSSRAVAMVALRSILDLL